MKIDKEKLKTKLMEKKLITEQVNAPLANQLRMILADTFVFYFKLHTLHWNIEGSNFVQYHEFLGKNYEAVFDIIDPLAEQIRMLDEYAPISLSELLAKATVKEFTVRLTDPRQMFAELSADIVKLNSGLTVGRTMAEDSQQTNLANFLDEILNANRKLDWMLKSLQK